LTNDTLEDVTPGAALTSSLLASGRRAVTSKPWTRPATGCSD
jgi:hypothetical protein